MLFATMKTKISFQGFDWDAGNRRKNEGKHGISDHEIENFFRQRLWVLPAIESPSTEQRFLAIGLSPSHQKPMIAIFTIRIKSGEKLIRPISARRMNEREEKKFKEAFQTASI